MHVTIGCLNIGIFLLIFWKHTEYLLITNIKLVFPVMVYSGLLPWQYTTDCHTDTFSIKYKYVKTIIMWMWEKNKIIRPSVTQQSIRPLCYHKKKWRKWRVGTRLHTSSENVCFCGFTPPLNIILVSYCTP